MVNHSPKTDTFGCLIPDDQVERSDVESLKQRVAELELLLKDRLAMPTYQIAGKRPDKCDGCFAPLSGDVCEYCGREAKVEPALPDEPHDIRKTNASDDPCPMCQRVHTKNAYPSSVGVKSVATWASWRSAPTTPSLATGSCVGLAAAKRPQPTSSRWKRKRWLDRG